MLDDSQVDWDQHHYSHARFAAHYIEDTDVAKLLDCDSINKMNMRFMSIADDLYNAAYDPGLLLQDFDYDEQIGLRHEGAFWAFIRECRLELEAAGCCFDSIGLADIAQKVDCWLH